MTFDNPVLAGDCRIHMAAMEPESVDAIVCDPPYELTNRVPDVKKCRECGRVCGGRDGKVSVCPRCGGEIYNQRSQSSQGFMGKRWDATGVAFDPATWAFALDVLKPGAYLLAMGSSRTYHRLVTAIEDSGFVIRDTICWIHGQGFPKSQSISKMIDKQGGSSAETSEWDGWGTALKPAVEFICVAQKPIEKKLTIAANVQKYGTGALNIDASRVPLNGEQPQGSGNGTEGNRRTRSGGVFPPVPGNMTPESGRWPANLILDEDAAQALDDAVGVSKGGFVRNRTKGARPFNNNGAPTEYETVARIDEPDAGPSRFFYTAKSSPKERALGLPPGEKSNHPTVKPLALMGYLITLVTPLGGLVYDPFCGSGSTGLAAESLGFRFIGSELESFDEANIRIKGMRPKPARRAYAGGRFARPRVWKHPYLPEEGELRERYESARLRKVRSDVAV